MADAIAWDGPAVIRMIEERRFDEAASRVSEILDSQPWHLPASIARARLLIAQGQTKEALELAEELAKRLPNNVWIASVRVDALVATGRIADAKTLFLGLLPPQPGSDVPVSAMVNAILKADPEIDQRLAFLGKALEAWPDSQLLLLKLATQNYVAARAPEAIRFLKMAEALGPLPEHAREIKDGLVGLLGDRDEAIRYLSERVAETPGSLDAMRHLIRLLAATGRFEAAGDRLIEGVERWPGDWRIAYRANHTMLDEARDARVFEHMKTAADAAGAGDLFLLQFAQFALRSGRDDLAAGLLATLAERPSTRHIAGPMSAALAKARGFAVEPPRIEGDVATDFEVVTVDGARATLVVFGSLVGGVGHLPFHLIDPILAQLPVNVVYLRDPYGMAYLNGVPSLGADEAATIEALAEIVAELGAERVVTMGTSIAGYAAARYGLAIGADATISFAGPIRLAVGPSTSRPVATAFEQLRNAASGTDDLTGALVDAGDTFHLAIVAGAEDGPDIDWASATATLDNVDVVPLEGVGHHFVAHASIAAGRFLPLLERFLDPDNAP